MSRVDEQQAREASAASDRQGALGTCLRIAAAHASINLKLDDELGTWHGLSWVDFLLLDHLDSAGGACSLTALVRPLGLRAPMVLRLVLPLEKTGLVARERDAAKGAGRVVLRPAGQRLLQEARLTAGALCAQALKTSDAGPGAERASAWLDRLGRTPALAL